jgi:hypothetical protein
MLVYGATLGATAFCHGKPHQMEAQIVCCTCMAPLRLSTLLYVRICELAYPDKCR